MLIVLPLEVPVQDSGSRHPAAHFRAIPLPIPPGTVDLAPNGEHPGGDIQYKRVHCQSSWVEEGVEKGGTMD